MSDIRDTLAQLDRRLSDLKREIASIGDEPEAAPPPPRRADTPPPPAGAGEQAAAESLVGAAQRPAPQPPPAARAQEPLVPAADVPSSIPAFAPPPLPHVTRPAAPPPPPTADPAAHQPPPAGPDPAPGPGPAGSPPPPAPGVAGAPSGDATHEIVGRAEAEAARLLAHAHERVDELKSQIEQLLGVRERMLQSARDLVRQYEEEITQLELRYPATTPAEATGAAEHQAAPTPPPPPGPVTPAASAAGMPPPGAPPPGAPPVGAPPVGAPVAGPPGGYAQHAVPPPPAAPAPEPAPRPALFEGVVSVIVPWVSRLQTIQVLEDSLTRVRGAQLAHVRGYHQGEVRLELVLGEAVDLIGELNRTLPYAFAVESARQDEIIIRLERGESGGAGVQ